MKVIYWTINIKKVDNKVLYREINTCDPNNGRRKFHGGIG